MSPTKILFSVAVVLAIFIDVHAEEDVVVVEDRQLPSVKVHKVYTNPEKIISCEEIINFMKNSNNKFCKATLSKELKVSGIIPEPKRYSQLSASKQASIRKEAKTFLAQIKSDCVWPASVGKECITGKCTDIWNQKLDCNTGKRV